MSTLDEVVSTGGTPAYLATSDEVLLTDGDAAAITEHCEVLGESQEAIEEVNEVREALESLMSAIPEDLAATHEVAVCRAISVGLNTTLNAYGLTSLREQKGVASMEAQESSLGELKRSMQVMDKRLKVANEGFVDTIKAAWNWLVEKIKAMIAKIKSWFGTSGSAKARVTKASARIDRMKAKAKDKKSKVANESAEGSVMVNLGPGVYADTKTVDERYIEKRIGDKIRDIHVVQQFIDGVGSLYKAVHADIQAIGAKNPANDAQFPADADKHKSHLKDLLRHAQKDYNDEEWIHHKPDVEIANADDYNALTEFRLSGTPKHDKDATNGEHEIVEGIYIDNVISTADKALDTMQKLLAEVTAQEDALMNLNKEVSANASQDPTEERFVLDRWLIKFSKAQLVATSRVAKFVDDMIAELDNEIGVMERVVSAAA